MDTPVDRYPALAPRFARLDRLTDEIRDAFAGIVRPPADAIYGVDLFYYAAVKRSLDVVDAIARLVPTWNFTVVAALVRMHLETLVRLDYVAKEANGDAVADRALHGIAFRDQRSPTGEKLTDAYLVRRFAASQPWAVAVYSMTNALVHLSERHFHQTIVSVDSASRNVQWQIGVGTQRWSEAEIAETIDCVLHVTELLLGLLDSHREWKTSNRPPQLEADTEGE